MIDSEQSLAKQRLDHSAIGAAPSQYGNLQGKGQTDWSTVKERCVALYYTYTICSRVELS